MSRPQRLVILGATGSIGASTLEVMRRHPQVFEVYALAAHTRVAPLFELCREWRPRFALVHSAQAAVQLRALLDAAGIATEVCSGPEALCEVVAHEQVDIVVAAIVGAAGLKPTLSAVEAGKTVLLANKEALVCGGRLVMNAVRASDARLLPVDSEHNAIFQCLASQDRAGIKRLLLTASGGPFLRMPVEQLAKVTPAQACAHPNWSMGAKISVDSATMMNKGLEIIEARWLFDCSAERIEVVIHPQSIIHSMVEYVDGSTLAQLSYPDMRVPIAHVLGLPQRLVSGVEGLDFDRLGALTFETPSLAQFPGLGLAQEAARREGDCPLYLNAANEVAVAAFLEGRLCYTDIYRVNATVVEKASGREPESLDDVLEQDAIARHIASGLVEQFSC